jgi:HK97 family phage major capsid protein
MSTLSRVTMRDRARNFSNVGRLLARAGPDRGLLQALLMAEQELGWVSPVTQFFKSAVAAGSLTGAPALAALAPMASEFIEFLLPLTVIGRLTGAVTVNQNVRVIRQTSPAVSSWVPESGIAPVNAMRFDTVILPPTKFISIIPFSNAVLKFMATATEDAVLNGLVNAAVAFMDSAFLDPSLAAVPSMNPASITNGGISIVATGTTETAAREDLFNLYDQLSASVNMKSPFWIMPKSVQIRLSFLETTDGLFSHLTPAGGYLASIPVLVSNAAAGPGSSPDVATLVLLDAAEVLLSSGATELDISTETNVAMDTNPDSPIVASTVQRSLWQNDESAIKLTRFAGWVGRRPVVAGCVTGAVYRP